MTAHDSHIDQHPDVVDMRRRYDEIAETPVAQSADGLAFLAGTFLAMSPWVIGFTSHPAMTASNLITGIAIALLALGFSTNFGRMHGMAWVAPVLGVWAIASPWLVAGGRPENNAMISNVIVGAVCVLCTLALMSTGMRRSRS